MICVKRHGHSRKSFSKGSRGVDVVTKLAKLFGVTNWPCSCLSGTIAPGDSHYFLCAVLFTLLRLFIHHCTPFPYKESCAFQSPNLLMTS